MLANDLSVLPQQAQERLDGLESRTAHIGVIGLGYVGLPLSLLLAENGFRVTGFDIDNRKVTELEHGRSYIYRIPESNIQLAREQGFRATSDFSQLPDLDAIIICVPTPRAEHREPDLTYIESTARTIAPWLQPGQLVVLESTTYPGTTEELLIPILEAGNGLSLKAQQADAEPAENAFYVAFSPEWEDSGNDTVARRDIPKVVGGHDPIASRLAAALYQAIFTRAVTVSSTRAAEMTKLLENIYR